MPGPISFTINDSPTTISPSTVNPYSGSGNPYYVSGTQSKQNWQYYLIKGASELQTIKITIISTTATILQFCLTGAGGVGGATGQNASDTYESVPYTAGGGIGGGGGSGQVLLFSSTTVAGTTTNYTVNLSTLTQPNVTNPPSTLVVPNGTIYSVFSGQPGDNGGDATSLNAGNGGNGGDGGNAPTGETNSTGVLGGAGGNAAYGTGIPQYASGTEVPYTYAGTNGSPGNSFNNATKAAVGADGQSAYVTATFADGIVAKPAYAGGGQGFSGQLSSIWIGVNEQLN